MKKQELPLYFTARGIGMRFGLKVDGAVFTGKLEPCGIVDNGDKGHKARIFSLPSVVEWRKRTKENIELRQVNAGLATVRKYKEQNDALKEALARISELEKITYKAIRDGVSEMSVPVTEAIKEQ